MRTVHVDLGERSYPIYIGTGLLPQAGSFLVKHGLSVKSPHLIVTDDKVAPHHLDTLKSTLEKAGFRLVVSVVKSGESSKSLQVFEEVMTSAIQGGLTANLRSLPSAAASSGTWRVSWPRPICAASHSFKCRPRCWL